MFRVADPDPIELPPISYSDPTKSLFETFYRSADFCKVLLSHVLSLRLIAKQSITTDYHKMKLFSGNHSF